MSHISILYPSYDVAIGETRTRQEFSRTRVITYCIITPRIIGCSARVSSIIKVRLVGVIKAELVIQDNGFRVIGSAPIKIFSHVSGVLLIKNALLKPVTPVPCKLAIICLHSRI